MKETPNHKLRYPETTDPNAYVSDLTNLAEDTERELDAIDPSQLVVPGGAEDVSKLLIVQNTGAAAFKAMSGDVSINEDGVTAIGNSKLATVMYQDGSVTPAKLSAAAKPLTWYAPKVIATEESTASPIFTTLATPDRITNVVLPENGLIAIGYQASWKYTKEEVAGSRCNAAIFIGANQLRAAIGGGNPAVQEASIGSEVNHFRPLSSCAYGLVGGRASGAGDEAQVTTGQAIGIQGESSWGERPIMGGFCYVFAAAGTYDISVKFQGGDEGGSVTAKSRRLWVAVLGT